MGDSNAGGGGPSPWAWVGLGFEIAAPIVVCTLGGRFLDVKLGTEPWLLLAGALLGIFTAFYVFFKTVLPRGGNAR